MNKWWAVSDKHGNIYAIRKYEMDILNIAKPGDKVFTVELSDRKFMWEVDENGNIQNKKEIESMKNNEKGVKAFEVFKERFTKEDKERLIDDVIKSGFEAMGKAIDKFEEKNKVQFDYEDNSELNVIFKEALNGIKEKFSIKGSTEIKAEEGYQGWSNHATWVINLHLDNEQNTQEMKREIILETRDEDKEKWIYEAAETLKSWVEDTMPELPPMWADMLNGYFEEVDFREIAEHEINEIGYNEENEKNKGKDLKKEFE